VPPTGLPADVIGDARRVRRRWPVLPLQGQVGPTASRSHLNFRRGLHTG
jgi:hypothetical protein